MPQRGLKTGISSKIDPKTIKVIMICEAPPVDFDDHLYIENTVSAFQSAGLAVKNIADIVSLGVYLTVAVPQPRRGVTVPVALIETHSNMLEHELDVFPNIRVIMLMGDTAIKALNIISRRKYGKAAVPSGSTYKIRKSSHYFGNIRVFPSYLQTGKNFLIEKSKREMVAEDLRNAFSIINS